MSMIQKDNNWWNGINRVGYNSLLSRLRRENNRLIVLLVKNAFLIVCSTFLNFYESIHVSQELEIVHSFSFYEYEINSWFVIKLYKVT